MNERQPRTPLRPLLRARTVSPQGLVADSRGAVLVMGVFMCACVVSVLWYLAGIGDAIIYRERLQEAADASAFSAAALSARGMNLIVLLNLIMACVLGVRVVMKGLQAGLALAGAILLFTPPPFDAFSAPCFQGAARMQSLINATRNPINYTLKGLSRAQKGIALVVPPAAMAGSVQVGLKYRPMVAEAGAASPYIVQGLPVEEGSTERLCEEAAHSVSQLLRLFAPQPVKVIFDSPVAKTVEGFVDKAIAKGQLYFCELGLGTPPDFGPEIEEGAKKACGEQKQKAQAATDQATSQYTNRCKQLGISCDGTEDSSTRLSPSQKQELANLRTARDAAAQQLNGFDENKCVKQKKEEGERKLAESDPTASDPENGTAGKEPRGNAKDPKAKDPKPPGKSPAKAGGKAPADVTPKKVTPDFTNGKNRGQVVAVARGNDTTLKRAPAAVRIASFRKARGDDGIEARANIAFAQAEFFFDCAGAWTSEECNGKSKDGNAMWHFRWRPRLRLFNAPFGGSFSAKFGGGSGGAERTLDVAAHAEFVSEALRNAPSTTPTKAQALLLQALKDPMILH